MAIDFAMNSESLLELSEKILETRNSLEEEINSIYSGIAGINDSWSGEAYNAFKEKCESYKPYLMDLLKVLEKFAEMFETSGTDGEALAEEVSRSCSSVG